MFLMGMHGYGLISSPRVVAAFDLSRYRCLVDLGGATGHLAIAACERYPHLRAIVFDLPDAVPLAQEIARASSVADRIRIVAGDFFVDPLPEGDVRAPAAEAVRGDQSVVRDVRDSEADYVEVRDEGDQRAVGATSRDNVADGIGLHLRELADRFADDVEGEVLVPRGAVSAEK
jgi:hypothetical protein